MCNERQNRFKDQEQGYKEESTLSHTSIGTSSNIDNQRRLMKFKLSLTEYFFVSSSSFSLTHAQQSYDEVLV